MEAEYYVWSTYTIINQAEADHLKIPVVEVSAVDHNGDGLNDKLLIQLTYLLRPNETVDEIFFMFLFDYTLRLRSRISMEMALISNIRTSKPSRKLELVGSLYLDQLFPLPSHGTFNDFDGLLINESRSDIAYYSENNIKVRYSLRNFTTRLKREVITWSSSMPSQKNYFTFRLEIRISEQRLTYKTGLFELVKWAWIQYLSIYLVLRLVVRKTFNFMIENRILPTAVIREQPILK